MSPEITAIKSSRAMRTADDPFCVSYDPSQNLTLLEITRVIRPTLTAHLAHIAAQKLAILPDTLEARSDEPGSHCPVVAIMSRWPDIFLLGADFESFPINEERHAHVEFHSYLDDVLQCMEHLYSSFGGRALGVGIVDGAAYGAGLEVLLTQDVVVATPKATFALPEVKFDAAPPIACLLLPRKCEKQFIRRMVRDGIEVSAQEAHREGLVDFIVDAPDSISALHVFLRVHARRLRSYKLAAEYEKQVAGISLAMLREAMHRFGMTVAASSDVNQFIIRLLLQKQEELAKRLLKETQ